MTRFSEEWYEKRYGRPLNAPKPPAPEEPKKKGKYKAEKINGYDSKREYRRSVDLKALQQIGQIRKLKEQVKYELIPAQRGPDGKVIERAIAYIADFVYEDREGNVIVEDAKGFQTPVFVMKRKMMLWFHGIRVVEV